MFPASQIISDFQTMYNDRWGYIPGSSGQLWTQAKQDKATDPQVKKYGAQWIGRHVADCSGAFVWAYRQHGLRIYHGSNRIARKYVVQLLPISEARPGMAAFKARKPGDRGYALPDEYKKSGDLNDYYHIGLVDDHPGYVLNSASTSVGVIRSSIFNGWDAVGYLVDVDYTDGGDSMTDNTQMMVTAKNGKPVNLRSEPKVSEKNVLCKLPVGTVVTRMTQTGEWSFVRCEDTQGYMMSRFLTPAPDTPDEPDTPETPADDNAAIQKIYQAQRLLSEALELLGGSAG